MGCIHGCGEGRGGVYDTHPWLYIGSYTDQVRGNKALRAIVVFRSLHVRSRQITFGFVKFIPLLHTMWYLVPLHIMTFYSSIIPQKPVKLKFSQPIQSAAWSHAGTRFYTSL